MTRTTCCLRALRAVAAAAALLGVAAGNAPACTNILVTRGATATESTFVTYSCDGGVFAAVDIVGGEAHSQGMTLDVYDDLPYFRDEALAEPRWLGQIPQAATTYRYIDVRGGADFYHLGGVNEWGVGIAESTLTDARPELRSESGMLAPFSACPARSLMTLALQRATTAREAIRTIGALAEAYGYSSPFPVDGEQLAVSDGREVWTMEIFGPGFDWSPGCGRPGAVWCAQRVPDGHVAVSANRSRIGEIDLRDADDFMASSNVYELAMAMGWWNSTDGRSFVWSEVYAPSERRGSILREWRVLSLVAPSLKLSQDDVRLPFSVPAERPLSAADVTAIQRDLLAGTAYDVTAARAFTLEGAPSPLACPQASPELYELLGVAPERTLSNRYASFSCVYETRLARPAAARGCAWFGFGPAATSCYVPIYTGCTDVPDRWSRTDLSDIDLSLPFWTMTLPGQLATLRWQDAYPDLVAVRAAAEAAFLAEDDAVASRAAEETGGSAAFLDALTAARMAAVERTYVALADYFRVGLLAGLAHDAPLPLPTVAVPALDAVP